MLSREQKTIRTLFAKLRRAQYFEFPKRDEWMHVPDKQGVYILYSPSRRVVHVGRTYRGTAGLRQRLKNHLHGASSFTIEYLKGHGGRLRNGYTFRCLPVASPRKRALLEYYASGYLCPLHLGTSKKKAPPVRRG